MVLNWHKFHIADEIRDPLRSSKCAAIMLLLLILGLFCSQTLTGHPWGNWVFCAAALILPLAIVHGGFYVVHFNIFLLFYFVTDLYPHIHAYPFSRLTLLLLYSYTVALIPGLRNSIGWLRPGKMTAKLWLTAMAVIILGAATLILWARKNSSDLSRYPHLLPDAPIGLLLLYGAVFAAFNAAQEEIIWRGIMMEGLDSTFGPGYLSLIIQAASFGAGHYRNGFPNDFCGAVLTFLGGLILGFIRRKSRGMFGCWVIHFFGDLTAFSLILYYARN